MPKLYHVISVCTHLDISIEMITADDNRQHYAFIIASSRGDIYTMTGNVMSYQSPMHIHVHALTHAMNNCDVLGCRPNTLMCSWRKTWSPWVNQHCTVFHLFQRRPFILFSSVKQMQMKWNHLSDKSNRKKENALPRIHHLIFEKRKDPAC